MKSIILVSVSLLLFFETRAQQYPVIGQFYYSQHYFNPAYAGSNERAQSSVLYRNQWTGLPYSPQTMLFNADGPIGKNLALGIGFMNDRIDNLNRNDVFFSGSYKIRVSDESRLQFGLKAGGSFIKSDLSSLQHWDNDDIVINQSIPSAFIYRMGAGMYFYNPKGYIGISCPDLLSVDFKKIFYSQETKKSTIYKNYFLTAGAIIRLNNTLNFIPNVLLKYYPSREVMVNLNGGFEINKTITFGAGIITPTSLALYTVIAVTKKIKLGYRFEYASDKFKLGNFGSHELMLAYGQN